MEDDELFTKVAKHNFLMRLISGFIIGIIGIIIGIFLVVFFAVNNQPEFIIMSVFIILAGALATISCGFFLFRKSKKDSKK